MWSTRPCRSPPFEVRGDHDDAREALERAHAHADADVLEAGPQDLGPVRRALQPHADDSRDRVAGGGPAERLADTRPLCTGRSEAAGEVAVVEVAPGNHVRRVRTS